MTLIEPFLFRDGRRVTELDFSGAANPEEAIAAHVGHFGLHQREPDGAHLLVRDLLGVHKLFFAVGRDDRVDSSTFLVDLLRAGHAFENVFSVPSGHYVRIRPEEQRYSLVRWNRMRFGRDVGYAERGAVLEDWAGPIRSAQAATFAMLSKALERLPVYVSLSGGLDSTTVAALARESIPGLRAVTFAVRNPEMGAPGTDLYFARRVAADLGLPLDEVVLDPDEILDLLDDVLVYGQDYRDFNVHCGLVNAAIGKAIGARHAGGIAPVILTGDTMNELLADYTQIQFRGRQYYGLPRLARGQVRRFLVGGLDSGDREVGILSHFGVQTVQPHALSALQYAALPGDLVMQPGSRARLGRAVLGDRIPAYVYARPKVRAQVASEGEPRGTLAVLVDCGIDQNQLKRRFAELLGINVKALRGLLHAGFYRFSTKLPAFAVGVR
jgi:asparagine synthetase B (glutamine-hydrolysing)